VQNFFGTNSNLLAIFFFFFWQKGINAYTCAMLITITKDGPPKVCPSSIAILEKLFENK
jgi:hypothetical protein